MTALSSSSFLFPIFLLSFAAATIQLDYFKNRMPNFVKVCLYSKEPKQFTPICTYCPKILYQQTVQTCVDGPAIPVNVTYTQANCIVGNCNVDMYPPLPGKKKGKREVTETKLDNNDDLEGVSLSKMSNIMDDNSDVMAVPYTMFVNGRNVTITSVEEYFVQPDTPDPTEDYDLDI